MPHSPVFGSCQFITHFSTSIWHNMIGHSVDQFEEETVAGNSPFAWVWFGIWNLHRRVSCTLQFTQYLSYIRAQCEGMNRQTFHTHSNTHSVVASVHWLSLSGWFSLPSYKWFREYSILSYSNICYRTKSTAALVIIMIIMIIIS